MENQTREKKLIINTLIFAFGNIGSKLISFLIVPIYTSFMTQGDFGRSDLYLVYIIFLLPIVSFSLPEAALRFTLTNEEKREKIFFSGMTVLCTNSGILILGAMVLDKFVESNVPFKILALSIVFQAFYAFLSQFTKGIDKNILFSIMSIVLSVCIFIFTYFLLKNMTNKIDAFFWSQIVSYMISVVLFSFSLKVSKYIKKTNFDIMLIKRMLQYSFPLIPNMIMWWVMNASSRFFIVHYEGYEVSGLYAIASKIPALLTVISAVFLQSWQISAVEEIKSKDNSFYYSDVMKSLTQFLIIIVSAILLFLQFIMSHFVSSNFYDAWVLVPILFIGVIFSNLSQFVGMSYLASMNTTGNLVTSILGAVICVILNFIFVPSLSSNGASLAMALSFAIVFTIRIFDTKKYVQIKVNWVGLLVLLLLLSVQSILLVSGYYFLNVICFILILFICREVFVTTLNKLSAKIRNRK